MSKEIIKNDNGNQYITGTYRIWKNPNGSIAIKFDGEHDLHYIPKDSKTYEKINKRFEEKTEGAGIL